MIKTYELIPIRDRAKSFYQKAYVIIDEKTGAEYLRSYDTIVASIDKDGGKHRHWDKWSLTTGRHINEFFGGCSKAEWDKMGTEKLPYFLQENIILICNLEKRGV